MQWFFYTYAQAVCDLHSQTRGAQSKKGACSITGLNNVLLCAVFKSSTILFHNAEQILLTTLNNKTFFQCCFQQRCDTLFIFDYVLLDMLIAAYFKRQTTQPSQLEHRASEELSYLPLMLGCSILEQHFRSFNKTYSSAISQLTVYYFAVNLLSSHLHSSGTLPRPAIARQRGLEATLNQFLCRK